MSAIRGELNSILRLLDSASVADSLSDAVDPPCRHCLGFSCLLPFLLMFLASDNVVPSPSIAPDAYTVASSSIDTVLDLPASMAANPLTNASSIYQSSVEVDSNASISGMVVPSSDPQPSSSLVDWDFNEALTWFHASS